jgi:hypothetical protein
MQIILNVFRQCRQTLLPVQVPAPAVHHQVHQAAVRRAVPAALLPAPAVHHQVHQAIQVPVGRRFVQDLIVASVQTVRAPAQIVVPARIVVLAQTVRVSAQIVAPGQIAVWETDAMEMLFIAQRKIVARVQTAGNQSTPFMRTARWFFQRDIVQEFRAEARKVLCGLTKTATQTSRQTKKQNLKFKLTTTVIFLRRKLTGFTAISATRRASKISNWF